MRKMPYVSVMLAALIFGGCGAEQRSGKTITLTGDTLEIVGDEYLFDPATVNAKPGRVQITLRNVGELIHNLKFVRGAQVVAQTPVLQPEQSAQTTVVLKPGTYKIVCTIGDHEALGMTGKFVVK